MLALLFATACAGGTGGWQVIEEYDSETGANRSFAEFSVADAGDSARIGLSCEDGAVRVSLYQKRGGDAEWLLPFNFIIAFADGSDVGRYTKPDLGTAAFQESVLGALENGDHSALEFRTQMGLVAADLASFVVPLDGVRSAERRLRGCAARGG